MIDLQAADTRVFLFHTPDAAADPGGAMDMVTSWFGRDRSGGQYANLRLRDISVTPDGRGGVFTTIVCSLGQAPRAAGEGSTPSI